jgi:signal transduction histidine kinase
MNIIDRFTRDRVSRFVWGILTIACLLALTMAGRGERRDLEQEVEAAKQRSLGYVSDVLIQRIVPVPGTTQLDFYYRDLYTAMRAEMFAPDPTLARVRLFDSNSVLLMTSDDPRRVREVQVDDPDVTAALSGSIVAKTVRQRFTFGTTGDPGKDTDLLQTFVPLRLPDRIQPAGVIQIDYLMDEIRARASGPWAELMWVFGVLSVICLGMTLLSMRASAQMVGAGVKTLERVIGVRDAPEGEDGGAAAELAQAKGRAAELESEAARARDEAQASREQLRQAEEAYRYLEKRLHQVQDDLARYEGQEPAQVDQRVAVLEDALRKSEAEITLLRASQADPDLMARLEAAEARAADAEARLKASPPAPATEGGAGTEELVAALAETEARLQAAEAALAAAQANRPATGVEPSVLALLEERLKAAEGRAAEAERRLDEIAAAPEEAGAESVSPAAASDLRSRLARTAARKKLGADEASIAAHAASAVAGAGGSAAPASGVAEVQSAVASELRGPVDSILGLSLSLKGLVETNEGKDLIRQLGHSAKKLEQLVADLGDAKKIAEGKLRLEKRSSDLDALVSRAVHEASGIEDREVSLTAESVTADVDPIRVQQMIDALLTNAVERTTPGETIRVKLTASVLSATIAVEDNNPAAAVVGPGLIFAGKLAELHGGRIEASTLEDGGGVFRIVLPLG